MNVMKCCEVEWLTEDDDGTPIWRTIISGFSDDGTVTVWSRVHTSKRQAKRVYVDMVNECLNVRIDPTTYGYRKEVYKYSGKSSASLYCVG